MKTNDRVIFSCSRHWVKYVSSGLAGITLVFSPVRGSRPSIHLSSTLVTPRLHLTETEETTAWRNLLVIRQPVGSRSEIFTSLEYGSENPYWQNSFRVHQAYWRQRVGKSQLKLGRLTQWNALRNLRIDGGEIVIRTEKAGSLKLLAGVKAVTDFSDTTFMDYPEWSLSWAKGGWGRSLELSAWSEYLGTARRTFTGITYQWKVFGWRYGQAVSFDLTEKQIHHFRARFSRTIGVRQWAFGFRQKRYVSGEIYPWIKESLRIAPTVFADVRRQRNGMQVWNQITYRIQSEFSLVWTGTLERDGLSVSVLAGKRDKSTLTGATLGYQKTIGNSLTAEMTAAYHTFNYGAIAGPSPSSSLRGQIRWSAGPGFQVIFFGQWAQNPIYSVDGRGGVTIHVAL
ncbi:MAG: hypothetical protein GXO90_05215 [FCB group bacterium]|nr:hypothetical protein [FCB group bacterium]